jgi:hypothetical protein
MLGHEDRKRKCCVCYGLVRNRKNNAQGICEQEMVSRNFYKFRFWIFFTILLINTCFSA